MSNHAVDWQAADIDVALRRTKLIKTKKVLFGPPALADVSARDG
jgi:hypothetical protein